MILTNNRELPVGSAPTPEEEDVLILGAGPTGMSVALELQRAGRRFVIVEKDRYVGGLAKTYRFGAFRADHGPHRYVEHSRYFKLIKNVIPQHWIKVNRCCAIYVDGKFCNHPPDWQNALGIIGVPRIARFALDIMLEKVKSHGRIPRNCEEYLTYKFGKTLAKFLILDFMEKVFGIPCAKMSTDLGQLRLDGLDFQDLREVARNFYYPKQGSGQISEAIERAIEKRNKVTLDEEPSRITHANNAIRSVDLKSDRSYRISYLVSTIPVASLIDLLYPGPPLRVSSTARRLRSRAQVCLLLTVNKPSVSRYQVIYFPEKEVPFSRLSEPKNFSKEMSPMDKTSVFLEFFCWEDDEIWNMETDKLLQLSVTWLEKIGLVKWSELIECLHAKQRNSHPVYELDYQESLDVVADYLAGFSNLICAGRSGSFKYLTLDESFAEGILAARRVLQNEKS